MTDLMDEFEAGDPSGWVWHYMDAETVSGYGPWVRKVNHDARITDLEAQLAAKDALIRDLVRAAKPAKKFIDDTDYRPGRDSASIILNTTLTRAKELGYE